ncbi:helix-turn-helix domain-containing protein [Clostridium beijerinckii]|uniref:helix-turn-helix domain-containing protein n=1 Tax=Clostridium beijerinckii TaxID=1520 RepID=UPI00136147AF|nr:helix-turn-helix transcriptional regulator [Clostridium beijerinckii]MZK53914.1 helix-turn-helix domain-containing protein [Clostridium beijerinckii]MZK62028.1 helix-turn-helix domain-containing protein [Clostridium beijerinckii]MZK72221.1 helix-turn-helix domain-containing protein [Clostridium beijerinckii]MZK77640.1 helix-turn-helix domain-containing protein [Clostridium beijerinckii]MZK87192.1 helix-turn-helix domain-containing protein [Clostridium beijerinckii]
MATFADRLKKLRKDKRITQEKLAERFFITKSAISKYENGVNTPENKLLQDMADFFEVSVDYLLGRTDNLKPPTKEWQPQLTEKDEKDIEKTLAKTLEMLEQQDGLMLSGELIDDEDFELIKAAIQNGLEYAKKVNKKKYTPKKYRK